MKRENYKALGVVTLCAIVGAVGPLLFLNHFYIDRWTATWVQAVMTIVVTLFAAIYPYLIRMYHLDNKEKYVKKEIFKNLNLVERILSQNKGFSNGEASFSSEEVKVAMIRNVTLNVWHDFSLILAVERPRKYEEFKKINDLAEEFVISFKIFENQEKEVSMINYDNLKDFVVEAKKLVV